MFNDNYPNPTFNFNAGWFRKYITHGSLVNIITTNPERTLRLAAGLKELLAPGVMYVDIVSHRDFNGELLNARMDFTTQAREMRESLVVGGGVGIVCDFFTDRPITTSKAVMPEEIDALLESRRVIWDTWVQQLDFVLVERADRQIKFHKCRGVPLDTDAFQVPD